MIKVWRHPSKEELVDLPQYYRAKLLVCCACSERVADTVRFPPALLPNGISPQRSQRDRARGGSGPNTCFLTEASFLVDDRGDLRGRLTLLTSDLVGVADLSRADGREDRYSVDTSNDILQLVLRVRISGAE